MDKKEQILMAALRLFVADGFHGTPTSKIAVEAAVANGTLFYHYKTKDELIIALYNKIKTGQGDEILPFTKRDEFITSKFKNIFIHSVNWALKNHDRFFYIQQFNFSPHLAIVPAVTLKQQSAPLSDFIEEGIRKKLLKQKPVELMLAIFNCQVYGVYQYLISANFNQANQEQIISEAYEMIWDMMKYM